MTAVVVHADLLVVDAEPCEMCGAPVPGDSPRTLCDGWGGEHCEDCADRCDVCLDLIDKDAHGLLSPDIRAMP